MMHSPRWARAWTGYRSVQLTSSLRSRLVRSNDTIARSAISYTISDMISDVAGSSRHEEFDMRHAVATGGDRFTSLSRTLRAQLERFAPLRGWPLITPLSP